MCMCSIAVTLCRQAATPAAATPGRVRAGELKPKFLLESLFSVDKYYDPSMLIDIMYYTVVLRA